jgi:hypothetical protein
VKGRRVNTKTIQNCFAHCGLKHSELEMANKANGGNDMEMHVGITMSFHESAILFSVTMKMKIKTSEDQETDEDDTTKCEQVTDQVARKFVAGLRL